MAEQTFDLMLIQTMAILHRYGFELKGYTPMELIQQWGETYSTLWIRLAVIEALYQGRYKSLSVEQILRHWLRKGKPNIHFSHEFERLICHQLPQMMTFSEPSPRSDSSSSTKIELDADKSTESTKSPEFEVNSQPSKDTPPHTPVAGKCISQFTPLIDHSQSYEKLRKAVYKALEEKENPNDSET